MWRFCARKESVRRGRGTRGEGRRANLDRNDEPVQHRKHVRPTLSGPNRLKVTLRDRVGERVLNHPQRAQHLILELLPLPSLPKVDARIESLDEEFEQRLKLRSGRLKELLHISREMVLKAEGDNLASPCFTDGTLAGFARVFRWAGGGGGTDSATGSSGEEGVGGSETHRRTAVGRGTAFAASRP
jgi:hypothetical protein